MPKPSQSNASHDRIVGTPSLLLSMGEPSIALVEGNEKEVTIRVYTTPHRKTLLGLFDALGDVCEAFGAERRLER